MRRLLPWTLALASLLGCSKPLAGPASIEYRRLTADELHQLVTGGKPYSCVDVRTYQEIRQGGTLPGCLVIPLDELQKRWREIPNRGQLVIVCRSGHRALLAARYLESQGLRPSAIGAMSEYTAKGYPVVYPGPSSRSGE